MYAGTINVYAELKRVFAGTRKVFAALIKVFAAAKMSAGGTINFVYFESKVCRNTN